MKVNILGTEHTPSNALIPKYIKAEVLNKIRAEIFDKIKAEISNLNCECIDYGDDYWDCDIYINRSAVLAMIDKYKVESEKL